MEEKLFDDFKKSGPEEWRLRIEKELKGKSTESLNWQKAGLSLKPFYTEEDLPQQLPNLDQPNQQATELGARNWVNYQVIKAEDEAIANAKALKALGSGATGLLFSLKKQPDFNKLLQNVMLPYCHVAIQCTENSEETLPSFEKYVETSGVDPKLVRGFIYGCTQSFAKTLPYFNTAFVHSPHENVKLELAFLLAQLIDEIDQKGLKTDDIEGFLKQSQFCLKLSDSYFIEIAKHRALRILLVELAKSYGLNIQAQAFEIASFSGFWTEPTKDEYNYLLRATTEAMSAITGGSNALIVQPFSELFPKNPDQGDRIARNISTLLKDESYFDKVIDPAAGSYYIESITNQIVEGSWQMLTEIEKHGGYGKLSKDQIEALIENY